MLPDRHVRFLRTGVRDDRYASDRDAILGIVGSAAHVEMGFDELMRLMRNPEYPGTAWWREQEDKQKAEGFLSWNFGRSRTQTRVARDAYRARTPVRLWLAAHACWPGKSGDAQYRAFVALITAAHDRGDAEFPASGRVLSLYAVMSRTSTRKALDQLVRDGIVKRTKHPEDGSTQYELHVEGFKRLMARTPEGVKRHPDEERILNLLMLTPTTTFPLHGEVAAARAEAAPCQHSFSSSPWSPSRDQEEGLYGAASAPERSTSTGWPIVNDETTERGWMPCHPAFGYGRLDQRVWLVCRAGVPVQASWIAAVTGMSVRTVRVQLAKLIAAGLLDKTEAGFVRRRVQARVLAQIAADNGGFESLRRSIALVAKEQIDYRGDPHLLDKLHAQEAKNEGAVDLLGLAQIDPVAESQIKSEKPTEVFETSATTPIEEVDDEPDEFVMDDEGVAAVLDGLTFDDPIPSRETWQRKSDRLRDTPPDEAA